MIALLLFVAGSGVGAVWTYTMFVQSPTSRFVRRARWALAFCWSGPAVLNVLDEHRDAGDRTLPVVGLGDLARRVGFEPDDGVDDGVSGLDAADRLVDELVPTLTTLPRDAAAHAVADDPRQGPRNRRRPRRALLGGRAQVPADARRPVPRR